MSRAAPLPRARLPQYPAPARVAPQPTIADVALDRASFTTPTALSSTADPSASATSRRRSTAETTSAGIRPSGRPHECLRCCCRPNRRIHPQVTTVLEFDPGEAAQVDFGKGPEVLDPRTGELLSTWIFVMTLAWSRHAYAEVVTDQKVATWLGCHRRAFEWFNGVPRRLTIENPKCAITRACYHDPRRSLISCLPVTPSPAAQLCIFTL